MVTSYEKYDRVVLLQLNWEKTTVLMCTYLLGSAPLKKALTVSVNAAATGSVSWAPMVRGLGPLEQPGGETSTRSDVNTPGNTFPSL